MNLTITPAAVRRSILVQATPARAFELFTIGMGRWWPANHTIGKSPQAAVVMEPRVGGRWYERGADGSECDWGRVLAWEPPGRVLLAWQLDGTWLYDPAFVTELEIRFVAEGEGTRVELEHRNLERFGEQMAKVRASIDSDEGWPGLLARYAAAAVAA
jgi:uncharacterized protein YndB with AHSA1/START domain